MPARPLRPHPFVTNVDPLVRLGTAANFVTRTGKWHRTEHFPSDCDCKCKPLHAKRVVSSLDDSWRDSPEESWAPCISNRVRIEANIACSLAIGDRVSIDPNAEIAYDSGRADEWYVEGFGRHKDKDGEQQIARIRNKTTNVYTYAPLHWVSRWLPDEESAGAAPTPDDQPEVSEEPVTVSDVAQPASLSALINLVPTEDATLTCILCAEHQCTHEFPTRTNGKRAVHGAHEICVRKIIGVEIRER